jgi:hypothetical protein
MVRAVIVNTLCRPELAEKRQLFGKLLATPVESATSRLKFAGNAWLEAFSTDAEPEDGPPTCQAIKRSPAQCQPHSMA